MIRSGVVSGSRRLACILPFCQTSENQDFSVTDSCVARAQACSSEGEAGRLPRVMAAFARPTRIVRGKEVGAAWAVDESKFELEEERALWAAYRAAAGQIRPDMSIPNFLQVCRFPSLTSVGL